MPISMYWALESYHLQPVDDVAQNLRAAALAGLAPIDPPLACLYATRFLGEPHTSVFNCEPAMTALDALVRFRSAPADLSVPAARWRADGADAGAAN